MRSQIGKSRESERKGTSIFFMSLSVATIFAICQLWYIALALLFVKTKKMQWPSHFPLYYNKALSTVQGADKEILVAVSLYLGTGRLYLWAH